MYRPVFSPARKEQFCRSLGQGAGGNVLLHLLWFFFYLVFFCFLPDIREERTRVRQMQMCECFEGHSCGVGKVHWNHTVLWCFLKWSRWICLISSRKTLYSQISSCPLRFLFPAVKFFFLSFIIFIVLKDYNCLIGSKTSMLSLLQLGLEPLIEISLGHCRKYMDRNNKVTMTLALRLQTWTNQIIQIISSEILTFLPVYIKK